MGAIYLKIGWLRFLWFWTWWNWEWDVLERVILIVLTENKNKLSNHLLKQPPFKDIDTESLWIACYSIWNPSSLWILLFSFLWYQSLPWSSTCIHAQIRAMNNLSSQSSCSYVKTSILCKNWPLCLNALHQDGIVIPCHLKSLLSFSIHSKYVWVTSKYAAKIIQLNVLQ